MSERTKIPRPLALCAAASTPLDLLATLVAMAFDICAIVLLMAGAAAAISVAAALIVVEENQPRTLPMNLIGPKSVANMALTAANALNAMKRVKILAAIPVIEFLCVFVNENPKKFKTPSKAPWMLSKLE